MLTAETTGSIDLVWPQIHARMPDSLNAISEQRDDFFDSVRASLEVGELTQEQQKLWESYGLAWSAWSVESLEDVSSNVTESLASACRSLRKSLKVQHPEVSSINEVLLLAINACFVAQSLSANAGQTD